MKRIFLLTIIMCSFLLTACNEAVSIGIIGGADGPTSIVVGDEKESDKWGLYLYAEDVTPKGLTLKIEQSGGNPSGSLEYGAAFTLETVVDNEWQPVETTTGEPLAWNMLGYSVKVNDITEMKIDWQYGYGELKPGLYRLKKEFMDFRAPGDFDQETYEVYFAIE